MVGDKVLMHLTCPHCGESFASAMQIDPETWERIRMNDGMLERCPHCGRSSRFAKGDYFFSSPR
jgi:phage terminase large subunit GpA-like protein